MGRISANLLDTNDVFPQLTLQAISGEKLSLPENAGPGYGVVFFYRGHW
jgi:hypothetical protein